MKQNLFATLGTDYAKDRQIIKKIQSAPNAFVGWVDSYNNDNGTVNIQPAIQRENIDENSIGDYVNRPFLNNVWVVANMLNRHPRRGDKALVLVLDEKSNLFFKTSYDNTKSLQEQTFVNSSRSVKTLSNCVAIIIEKDYAKTTYTEDEVEVGTWIDGKTVYRKVFQYSEAITENVLTTIGSIGNAVDNVIKVDRLIRNSNNEWWSDDYFDTAQPKGIAIKIDKDTGDVQVLSTNENWGTPVLNVIVEYTKN